MKPTISHKQIATFSISKVRLGSLGLKPAHSVSGHSRTDATDFWGEVTGNTSHAIGEVLARLLKGHGSSEVTRAREVGIEVAVDESTTVDEVLAGLLESHGSLEVTRASEFGVEAASEVHDRAVSDEVVTGLFKVHGCLEVTWASILGSVSVETGSEVISANDQVSVGLEGGNLITVVSRLTVEDGLGYSHVGSSWVADSKILNIVGLGDGAVNTKIDVTHSEGVLLERSTDSVVLGGECGGTHGHDVALEWLTDRHVRADVAGGTDLHLGAVERSSHGHNITLEWLTDRHVRADVAGLADLHLGAVERSSHGHNITLEWLTDRHVRTDMAGFANSHLGAIERSSHSQVVSVEAGSQVLTSETNVANGTGSLRGVLDVGESTKDGAEEDIELGVLLDALNGVVSLDHSLEFLLRGLIATNSAAGFLDGEGEVGGNDNLVDITTDSGGVDNLVNDAVLDRLVSNLSDDLVLRDSSDLLSVLGVDLSDFVLTLLEDLFDILGGIGDIIGILNDLDGLVVGLLDDLLDLLFLLILSFLNTGILNVFVVLGKGLEAVSDLVNNNLELFFGADVGDSLEGDTLTKGLLGLINRLVGGYSRFLWHIEDNNLVKGSNGLNVIAVSDSVHFLEISKDVRVETAAHDLTIIF
ncbi:MAG: hypothetical protein GY849_16575 [Deltaproteobacteria bacterium]|nr:hypothetical protein [Deltaproteobacteria bacterium]